MLFIIRTDVEQPLAIYQLSYMWYSACGCFTVIIVGLIVSAVTGLQDPRKLNPNLICNVGNTIFCFLPEKAKEVRLSVFFIETIKMFNGHLEKA